MNNLNARLIMLIVSFVFFSATLLGVTNMYISIQTSKENLFEDCQTIARQLASEIEYLMVDNKGLVKALAISPTMYEMDRNEIYKLLTAVQQKYPQIEEMNVMDITGQQIVKTANNDLVNRGDRPYFKEAMQGKTFFSDAYISVATKMPCIKLSTPIKNSAGQIVGVFAVDISLKTLSDIVDQIKIGQAGYIDIVDAKGALLAHKNKERVEKLETVADLPYVQEVMKGKAGIDENISTIGVSSLVSYAPMNMLGWGIIVYQPIDEFKVIVIRSVLITLALVIVVVLLAGIASIYVARSVTRPLRLLASSADEITGGDLQQPIMVRGLDEINRLADSLETMRQSLNHIIGAERMATEQATCLTQATSRFVPLEFLRSLNKRNIVEIKPGDNIEKEVTIFFTDIRSYTTISENMTSIEVFNFINQYLDIAVEVITKNNGFIDKFIGDAVMGLFEKSTDDALVAVVELFEQLKKYNSQADVVPITIGAGIHCGYVTMGTVGTEQRMDTTVIGDAVNLAARLESATKAYGMNVLISEVVYNKLTDPRKFNIREIDTVKVKGKNLPVKIYEVFNSDDSELKAGKIKIAEQFNTGLSLYKAGNFEEALQQFKECKEICPGDGLLLVYIKRCTTLMRIPPGKDWAGVSGI